MKTYIIFFLVALNAVSCTFLETQVSLANITLVPSSMLMEV